MAGDGDAADPYRQARIAAALLLVALVCVRGLIDVFSDTFAVSDVYGAVLLGAALALLGIARWSR